MSVINAENVAAVFAGMKHVKGVPLLLLAAKPAFKEAGVPLYLPAGPPPSVASAVSVEPAVVEFGVDFSIDPVFV